MAKKSSKKTNSTTVIVLIIIALLAIIPSASKKIFGSFDWKDVAEDVGVVGNADLEKYPISVHFIDVGQGDCTLVTSKFGTILVDSGENEYKDEVCDYISNLGIKKIDYLIATHPHSDHIGCMYAVVDNFEIGKFYMSDIDDDDTPTSKTYELLLNLLDKNHVDSSFMGYGDSFSLGEITCKTVAPVKTIVGNLNSMSIVLKVEYKSFSVLLTGDAETDEEKTILAKKADISADILKVGHHGSRTSSSMAFLKAVSPQYAVISCGKDNKYSHPHKETINKLNRLNIPYVRTDEKSTMIFSFDGEKIITDFDI